ncbi:MAG: beta-propeller fold lactonase family protein [Lachnospiraceae bacterium]|nr:beta-propeller fold lactonase family protein [Lachnospiraceae bacterium]
MSRKIFAVVGSFATKPNPDKGLRVYEYEPEYAGFTFVGGFHPEINAGQTYYNEERDILYIAHEAKGPDGETCGGGRIYSGMIDHETGQITLIDDKETNATLPCYIRMTASGKYAMVAHHGTRNVVTKIKYMEDGSSKAYVECDDVVIALMEIKEDGTIQGVCDYCFHEPDREENGIMISKIPHLHCCEMSPDGNLFISCDKGLDVIHRYHVDEDCGKIQYLGKTFVEEGVHPRYAKFHPMAQVFYQNCENSLYIHVWQ